MRAEQQRVAKHQNMMVVAKISQEEVERRLAAGEPHVIR